MIMNIKKEKS